MKRTYTIINENNFQKWCDKHNLKPPQVYKQLKKRWPLLKIQSQAVRFWYTGARNIDVQHAPFLNKLSNGELTIENILYTSGRIKKINKILNSEVCSNTEDISEGCPSEVASRTG